MQMAKASERDINDVLWFLTRLQIAVEDGEYLIDEDDIDSETYHDGSDGRLAEFVQNNYDKLRGAERIVWGYKTLVDNVCEPDSDVLELRKPAIDPLQIRCRITDAEALRRVTPERLESYLRERGWEPETRYEDETVWALRKSTRTYRMMAPNDEDSFGTLPTALSIVADAENRSEMAVLVELLNEEA